MAVTTAESEEKMTQEELNKVLENHKHWLNEDCEGGVRMKNVYKAVYVICVILLVWLAASYVNTILHNATDYKYAFWNLFDIYCRTRG